MARRSRRMTRRMKGGESGLEEAIGTFTAANTAYDPKNKATETPFVEALNAFIGKLIAARDELRPPLQQHQLVKDNGDDEPASEPSPPTPSDSPSPSFPPPSGSAERKGGRRSRRSRRRRRPRKSRRRH